ncbi:MAG: ABC transporter permease [Anaerolineaceae bacterium]|nr:ABC transporter permease [Anaerolineaceae bacterium]
MFRLWTIMKKEILHIWRDPRTMALIIILPAMLLLLLGYGISGENIHIPIAVADLSRSDQSRDFIQKFTVSGDFDLQYLVNSENEIQHLIDINSVKVGMLIPEDFGRRLSANKKVDVVILIDGSANPTDASTFQLKLNAFSQMASQDVLIRMFTLNGMGNKIEMPIDARTRILYNPSGDIKVYMIPGLICVILQVQTLLLSALAIVKEREQGTMEQLIVTPIKPWELMLGKIIPYLVVCLIDLFIMLWLGRLLFGVTVRGSMLSLIGLSAIFIIGSLGMGVLISNISQTQMQAIYIAMFIVVIPAIILSGLIFPRESMPRFTYWYSELLPVTQFLQITRGIIVRGTSAITLLWTATIPMIITSILYFIASLVAFRKHI